MRLSDGVESVKPQTEPWRLARILDFYLGSEKAKYHAPAHHLLGR